MAKRWQKSEISYLQRYGKTKPADELARRFKTDVKTVRAKLAELAPAGGKKAAAAAEPADPTLTAYTDAVKAMHKQDWAKAVRLFQKLVGDDDRPEIAARALQYLAAARQRLEAETGKAGHEDAYLKAVFEKNRGNLAAALEICRRGGREKKDERFAYLAASIHALENRPEEAAQAIALAVELNPKNRIHAYHDDDFAELRKDREFRHLLGFP